MTRVDLLLRHVAVALALLCALPEWGSAQTPAAKQLPWNPDHEAAGLASSIDTSPTFLNPATVDSVKRTLAAIRRRYTDLAQVWDPGHAQWLEVPISVELADSLQKRAYQIDPHFGGSVLRYLIRHTQVAVLDSLDEAFDVQGLALDYLFGDDDPRVQIKFQKPMNLRRVASSYRLLPGVRGAGITHMFDNPYGFVRLSREGPRWTFTFGKGEGDCPAGCPFRTLAIVYDWPTRKLTRGHWLDVDRASKPNAGN
jgi:hypothetical protein